MSEPIWNKFLTERDKAVFAAGGFGARAGFGKRPALLVIDVNWAFCGERPEPILESIKKWRTSCGEDAWVALDYIKQLIDRARLRGLPVIYTTGEGRPDKWDRGSWGWKSSYSGAGSGVVQPNRDRNEIVAMIAPGPKDIVIRKQKPSGFFGSNLASYLTLLGADSVIVVGTTTSGCVRATAVDAFSLNYRVILAEEGCFDRSEASHDGEPLRHARQIRRCRADRGGSRVFRPAARGPLRSAHRQPRAGKGGCRVERCGSAR
jgi:maleamate amidohydrolase